MLYTVLEKAMMKVALVLFIVIGAATNIGVILAVVCKLIFGSLLLLKNKFWRFSFHGYRYGCYGNSKNCASHIKDNARHIIHRDKEVENPLQHTSG